MSSAWFGGIVADFKRRAPSYVSDWTDGHNAKTTASIFFMFFTSIAPAVTFAGLLDSETDEGIGVVEVLLSSALSGIIFSVFAGQPLVIVGVTGPVTILTIAIYGMAKALNISFVHFYAWAQIFAALMHMFIAASGWCDAIKYITNFSCHTFGMLIALIYAVTGVSGIVGYFTKSQPFAACLMELVIALGTTWLALALGNANSWTCFNAFSRNFIADYAPTVSILVWTAISLIGRSGHLGSDLSRLETPRNFSTTSGRPWFVNLFDTSKIPVWGIVLSLVPACIITVLFIFDHNVSSIMAQSKEFRLKKGSAYHLDFWVLGWCILVTGVLGVPPCNGLIPQAPLHTKSLCVVSKCTVNGVEVDSVERTYEQRYTNFLQAALTGLCCFRPFLGLLGKIPTPCLDGLFIFMALSSLPGNELWERACLLVSEPALRASARDFFQALDFATVRTFTRAQLFAAVLIYAVTLTPAAMTFPLFIAALVYVRMKLLPRYFSDKELQLLDPLIELDPTVDDISKVHTPRDVSQTTPATQNADHAQATRENDLEED